MKTSLPVFFILLIFCSCKDKTPYPADNVCGVTDPVRNLSWLRNMVEEAKRRKEENLMNIVAVKVRGETIINYYMLYMSCIGCISYQCDGSKFDMSKLTQAEMQEYQKNVWDTSGNRIVLWPEK